MALVQVSFGNGRIEEFYIACNCLSAEQMAEPDVARALAAAMASFHFESLLHLPPSEASEPQARQILVTEANSYKCLGWNRGVRQHVILPTAQLGP